jgi:hypothetical protein
MGKRLPSFWYAIFYEEFVKLISSQKKQKRKSLLKGLRSRRRIRARRRPLPR